LLLTRDGLFVLRREIVVSLGVAGPGFLRDNDLDGFPTVLIQHVSEHPHGRDTDAPAPAAHNVKRLMKTLRQLRLIALLEGTSFLVLLFIAMPLKYLVGLPLAVRIVGSVHGLFFLMFVAALYRAGSERRWPLGRSALAFVSSIVPFGTFVFDRSLRREIVSAEGVPPPDRQGN
jgi:integral membrane protein